MLPTMASPHTTTAVTATGIPNLVRRVGAVTDRHDHQHRRLTRLPARARLLAGSTLSRDIAKIIRIGIFGT